MELDDCLRLIWKDGSCHLGRSYLKRWYRLAHSGGREIGGSLRRQKQQEAARSGRHQKVVVRHRDISVKIEVLQTDVVYQILGSPPHQIIFNTSTHSSQAGYRVHRRSSYLIRATTTFRNTCLAAISLASKLMAANLEPTTFVPPMS